MEREGERDIEREREKERERVEEREKESTTKLTNILFFLYLFGQYLLISLAYTAAVVTLCSHIGGSRECGLVLVACHARHLCRVGRCSSRNKCVRNDIASRNSLLSTRTVSYCLCSSFLSLSVHLSSIYSQVV